MKHVILPSILALAVLSGCGVVQRLHGTKQAPVPAVEIVAPVAPAVVLPPMGQAKTAAALDQATAAQKAEAAAPVQSEARALGRAVVALGSPAEQGFWVKSSLVAVAGKGHVVTASGASVNVDLQPGSGAALLSLSAFRALGLGLTDLPEVTIYAN